MKLSRLLTAFILFHILISASAQEQVVTLEQAIALALERNYDVRVAKNFKESASIDDRLSVGAYFPTINANGSRTWNVNNQKQELANGDEVERIGIKTNNLTGQVQLNWLLFDGARMFATRERLAQIEQQGEINVKEQMVNTIAQVSNNY